MAEFNSYLLGKARKSVGNLTIVYAKGKNIVRAKVFGRKDNPTPEVLMQRMRVRLLGRFARRILPVIRKGFAGVGKGTAYNAFMAANMKQVTVDEDMTGSIDFETLQLASGLLYTPRVEVTCEEDPVVYRFVPTAEEAEEGFAALDDKVYGVLLETALQRVRLVALKNRGIAGETEVPLPDGWNAAKVNVYCFVMSGNERMVSDSIFLPVSTQA